MTLARPLHLCLILIGSVAGISSCQGTLRTITPDQDPPPGSTDPGADSGQNTDAGETPDDDSGATAPGTDSGAPGSDSGSPGTDSGSTPPPPPPTGGEVSSANVLFIGHSLINWNMPSMVAALAADGRRSHRWDAQIGNGGSIQAQWQNVAEGVNGREALASGAYDVLVLTEAIPLMDHYTWSGSVEYAGRFYDLAQEHHPGLRTYMFETWHSTTTSGWRGRIDSDRALWERIVDEVNAGRSGPDMLMIPGGTALGQLVDRVEAGGVPGITSRDQLFEDDIHMNDLGNYFIACVQFATIYRMSPIGLTTHAEDRWGGVYSPPSAGAARVMQEIAWDVVSNDPRSGVR